MKQRHAQDADATTAAGPGGMPGHRRPRAAPTASPKAPAVRIAEGRVTGGVVAARKGDVEEAVVQGRTGLADGRKSLPSLLMVSSELAAAIHGFPGVAPAVDYLDELRQLGHALAAGTASG